MVDGSAEQRMEGAMSALGCLTHVRGPLVLPLFSFIS